MNEEIEFNSLDKSFYRLMVIKRLIGILLVLLGVSVYYLLGNLKGISISRFWIIFGAILLVGIFVLMMAKVYFDRKKYRLFDKNLTYRKGLLVHKETTVPFSRIQHIEIDEGPLERYFKLATMSIYTAGDSGKDLKINGLKVDEAQEMKEFITNYMKNE